VKQPSHADKPCLTVIGDVMGRCLNISRLLCTQQLVEHSQTAEPVKAFMAQKDTSGVAIKAALSVSLYALNKTTNSSKNETIFSPTN
jgi:hypothetical protein